MNNAYDKMIELVRNKTGEILPENVDAESVMQDETGYVFLKLAIAVKKDIITSAGYYASEEIPIDTAAAMAAVTQLMKDRAIMSAAMLTADDIGNYLEFDEQLYNENGQAVKIAEIMLKECLRNYSMKYNALREERLRNKNTESSG